MRLSRRRWAAVVTTTGLALAGVGVATTGHALAASAGCQVTYQVTSQWPGGFGASVNVTNLGDPVSGWQVTWNFTAGQTVSQAWNTTLTQSGAAVTAANAAWNGSIGAGASASFGFNGT